MSGLYIVYIFVSCRIKPDLAPVYDVPHVPWSEKIGSALRYLLPLGVIILWSSA